MADDGGAWDEAAADYTTEQLREFYHRKLWDIDRMGHEQAALNLRLADARVDLELYTQVLRRRDALERAAREEPT